MGHLTTCHSFKQFSCHHNILHPMLKTTSYEEMFHIIFVSFQNECPFPSIGANQTIHLSQGTCHHFLIFHLYWLCGILNPYTNSQANICMLCLAILFHTAVKLIAADAFEIFFSFELLIYVGQHLLSNSIVENVGYLQTTSDQFTNYQHCALHQKFHLYLSCRILV